MTGGARGRARGVSAAGLLRALLGLSCTDPDAPQIMIVASAEPVTRERTHSLEGRSPVLLSPMGWRAEVPRFEQIAQTIAR